jgi:4-amino-4-deoxy-L-arabinose transferase-like glycosyltransferase
MQYRLNIRTNLFLLIAGLAALLTSLGVIGWKGIQAGELLHFGWLLLHSMVLLGVFLLGAFGLGTLVMRVIGSQDRGRLSFYLYSSSLGFGVLGHLTLALGVLGAYTPTVTWALILGSALLTPLEIIRGKSAYRQAFAQIKLPEFVSWFSGILILLLAANWLYPLLSDALLPPLSWDEVAYHLAIPKIYIQNHALTYISFIPYSNWPLETEMLFTLGLLLSSETLTHLISWIAFLLTCVGIYIFGQRYFGTRTGLLSATVFSATPMVTTLAGTALIELPLTLFTFLATMTMVDWLETQENNLWLLSALFGGLAASTKLNAALVPLILALFMAIVLFRRKCSPSSVGKRFMIYGLIAAGVVAPWYVKTWIMTGNPFWPFLFGILGGRNWDALGSEYLFGFIRLPNMALTPANWLRGLWFLTADPVKFGPYRVSLGWQYLILLPFTIPALIRRKPNPRRILRAMAILGLIFYTSWFLQTHQTRFLMPTTAILALVAAVGITWLWQRKPGGWSFWPILIQGSLLIFMLGTNWLVSPVDRNHVASRWPYLSGQITRDQFLESQIPGYDTYLFANHNLPTDAYVWLALYESRGYYLDRDYMWANPISQRAFPLESFDNSDELAAALSKLGFTHIIFRSAQLERYTYIRHGKEVTALTQRLLAEHGELLYQSSELELYALRP